MIEGDYPEYGDNVQSGIGWYANTGLVSVSWSATIYTYIGASIWNSGFILERSEPYGVFFTYHVRKI